MATAKQQRVESEYSVTLKISGAKLEPMSASAKKIGVEVVKVKKFVEPAVVHAEGEWTEHPKPESEWAVTWVRWTNPDGRSIRYDEITDPDDQKHYGGSELFSTYDAWGRIGRANTLEEAKKFARPVVTTEEALEYADELALEIIKDSTVDSKLNNRAEDYLADRRIPLPESEESEGEVDKNPRRKPTYIVTLTIEASKFETVQRKAQDTFGDKLVGIEKVSRNFSRHDDLMSAKEMFEEGASIITGLREQMEEWRDNMEERFGSTAKYEDVGQCASDLESLADEADSVVNGCDNIDFPGMY
jgi:hypothetical protein